MKRLMLTLAMAFAAIAFAGQAEAATETVRVHRGCHRTGVRRAGRNGMTHHHFRKIVRPVAPADAAAKANP